MKKLLGFLVSQRVTVTYILFLLLLFVILPLFIFTDFFPSQYDTGGDFSFIETIITLSLVTINLSWYFISYLIKKKKQYIIYNFKYKDFVTTYENGFAILADIFTFNQSQKIGLKNLKTVFACHALFIVFIFLLFFLLALINFDYLVKALENRYFIIMLIFIYIAFIVFGYNKVRKLLK